LKKIRHIINSIEKGVITPGHKDNRVKDPNHNILIDGFITGFAGCEYNLIKLEEADKVKPENITPFNRIIRSQQ
jgi:hypothetical protein